MRARELHLLPPPPPCVVRIREGEREGGEQEGRACLSLCLKRGKYGEIPTPHVSLVVLPKFRLNLVVKRSTTSENSLPLKCYSSTFGSMMHPFPLHRGVPTLHCPPAQPPLRPLPPRHSFTQWRRTLSSFTALKLRAKSRLIGNGELQIASYRFGADRPRPNEASPRTTCQDKMPTDFESGPHCSSFSWCLKRFHQFLTS